MENQIAKTNMSFRRVGVPPSPPPPPHHTLSPWSSSPPSTWPSGDLVTSGDLVISGDPSLCKLDSCAEPKLGRRRKDWTNLPPGNSSFPNSSRLLVMRIWRGKTPSPTTPPTPKPKRRGPTLNLYCDKRSKSWLNCSSRGDYNTDPNSPLNLSSTSSADFCQNKVITISTILTKILKMMLSNFLNSSPQFSPEPNAC